MLVADISEYYDKTGELPLSMEWLHIIGYQLGGPEIDPNTEKEWLQGTGTNPQLPDNLVLGTYQANRHMLVYEQFLSDYLKGKNRKMVLDVINNPMWAPQNNEEIPHWFVNETKQ